MNILWRSLLSMIGVAVGLAGLLWAVNIHHPVALAMLPALGAIGIGFALWQQYLSQVERQQSQRSAEENDRLQRMESNLNELRGRSNLLVCLSGEIRALLDAQLEVADQIVEAELSFQQRRNLASLRASTETLYSYLDDILDLSNIDLGKLSLTLESFHVRETLNSWVNHARDTIQKERQGKLTHHVHSRVPHSLRGDMGRTTQVLSNFLDYAANVVDDPNLVLRVTVDSRADSIVDLRFQIESSGSLADQVHLRELEAHIQTGVPLKAHWNRHSLPLVISLQLTKLLGGVPNLNISDSGFSIGFSARFQVVESSAFTPTPVQRTQLGLIPDLPVLLFDSKKSSRDETEKMLIRWQTEPVCLDDASMAIAALDQARRTDSPFDLVIIDADRADDQGFELCREIKEHQLHSAIPVIMIINPEREDHEQRALDAGAVAKLSKPVKSSAMARAIITAVLGKGRYRQLRKDVGAAENYVRSLIPPPISTPIQIDWRYVPTADLAGDALGFHWIDDEHCALYVIDVCGHGMDAALLSVTILNVIKSMALPVADFRDPADVLAQLNNRFPMESHGDRCFTAWYGVYNLKTGRLNWSGGGHPAALVLGTVDGEKTTRELPSSGPMMGMIPDAVFTADDCQVSATDVLYVYSDGVFEIERPDGTQWRYSEYLEFLNRVDDGNRLDALWQKARSIRGGESLDDDFTIMEVHFAPAEE